MMRRSVRLVPVVLFLIPATGSVQAARSVTFTHVPAFGQTTDDTLTGKVCGVNPATHRVAIHIKVGDGWWTKPTFAQPLTVIQGDGTSSADIVTGGGDKYATLISARVVPAGLVPPDVGGDPCVPASITSAAVASTTVVRPNTGLRNLHWCGFDWWVKDSAGSRVGPGNNYFSQSSDQVWIDSQSRLHLRISNVGGLWQCAEIVTYATPGYGRYIFRGDTAPNSLDANAVLGLFTWADRNEDPNHREIDIEWSRWGNPTDLTNSQFVVQPYSPTGHLQRITIPAGTTSSVQQWNWLTTGVSFQALEGTSAITWNYPATNTVSPNLPVSCDENVRCNLWLCNNAGPTSGQATEVVLTAFEHHGQDTDGDGMSDAWESAHGLNPASDTDATADDDGDGASNGHEFVADTDPADPASRFRIVSIARDTTQVQLTFTTRPDKAYDIETSPTLAPGSWTTALSAVAGTGSPVTCSVPWSAGETRNYFRVKVR